jgi:hypothetical protein
LTCKNTTIRMTVTTTQFVIPSSVAREDLLEGFQAAAPHFRTMPGLVRKNFLLSEDGKTAGGCYLWTSREDAVAFNEGCLREMVRSRFGVEARIEYFDCPLSVEGPAT